MGKSTMSTAIFNSYVTSCQRDPEGIMNMYGYFMDMYGYVMDMYGYFMDIYGYFMDIYGYFMDSYGYFMDIYGYFMDIYGYFIIQPISFEPRARACPLCPAEPPRRCHPWEQGALRCVAGAGGGQGSFVFGPGDQRYPLVI